MPVADIIEHIRPMRWADLTPSQTLRLELMEKVTTIRWDCSTILAFTVVLLHGGLATEIPRKHKSKSLKCGIDWQNRLGWHPGNRQVRMIDSLHSEAHYGPGYHFRCASGARRL